MAKSYSRTRSVTIKVTDADLAIWKCAAALEPVPPTSTGLSWDTLLHTPRDPDSGFMTLKLPTRFLGTFTTRENRSAMFLIVPHLITQEALAILERHGLQPIRPKDEPEAADHIPF